MELERAKCIAAELLTILRPSCERIEIAGSIRRRKAQVKDIELLAVPRERCERGAGSLFEAPVNLLHRNTDQLTSSPRSTFQRGGKWGPKYRKLVYRCGLEEIAVDLFMVTRETWGPQLAIRTGPAEFSHRLVSHGPWGCMPEGYQLSGGMVRGESSGLGLCHCTEEEFFRFLNLPCWEPHERTEQRLAAYLDQHAMTAAGR